MGKAEAFLSDAKEAGWEAALERNGAKATVTATRPSDGAVMSISWQGEACLNECSITTNGHFKKLRNAAACRRTLTSDTPAKSPVQRRKQRPATPAPEDLDDVEDVERTVPEPDWGRTHADVSDTLLLEELRGKTITWINVKKRMLEQATIDSKRNRHLRIEVSPVSRKRAVTFAAQGDGFRSIYVDRIVSVA